MHEEGGRIGQILVRVLSAAAEMHIARAKRYFALHLTRNDYSTAGDNRPGLGVEWWRIGGDDAAIRFDVHQGTTWGKVGEPP